jgi:hypothetical protein
MTESVNSTISAAKAVMEALEPLAPDERTRVLKSASALYGIVLPSREAALGAESVEADSDEEGRSPKASSANRGKRKSLVEFLQEKDPATNAQRLATFAYYREHVEGKGETFGRGDLEDYFASAKLKRPSNYDRDWRSAVSEGWIHDDGSSSYLTQSGEAKVSDGFGGRGKARGTAVTKKRKKKTPTE